MRKEYSGGLTINLFSKTLQGIGARAQKLLETVYPVYCYGCRFVWVDDKGLCASCKTKLRPIVSTSFVYKKYHVPIFAAYAYQGPLCDMIRAKKRSDGAASVALAYLLDQTMEELRESVDCLIPVPLHPKRESERGFNQARVIAQKLADLWNIPVFDSVERIKETKYQVTLSAEKRIENVKDAFAFKSDDDKKMLEGRRIGIVDDLYTTGATVQALIKVFAQSKPESIIVFVAARAVEE